MQDFITLANHLADESGEIIRKYFRATFDVEQKSDDSPVTIADKAVEQRLRTIIEEQRPEDGIIGEEFGIKPTKNQYTWVFDPIDGTKSFVVGRANFGTLIALCENGVPILGIIDQPILNERWVGAKGMPTTFNGKDVTSRKCSQLSDARVSSTSPSYLDCWKDIHDKSEFLIWGGDCYSYGLVTLGALDAVVENELKPFDYAAIPPIIEGAGGHMCDWSGNPLTLDSKGDVLALGDVALKQEILALLG